MKKNNIKNQKGISIYLALLLISIFLDLSLGLTFIIFGEILTARDIDNSIIAFYAADTAIEKIIWKDNVECLTLCDPEDPPADCTQDPNPCRGLNSGYFEEQTLLGEAFYDVSFLVDAEDKIATSTGFYKKTSRSLEVEY